MIEAALGWVFSFTVVMYVYCKLLGIIE